ncbi:DUF262 domain-containing protein [Roseateles sp. BYS96W]|uniref:DUF262 domain-containing protein n=1 Tax=Pelomonas nitida TaxID=3299027 RepID=A0ABW7GDA5_9BURK
MAETPSYVSEPQVTDLPKLLSDVRAGHIQVPRFQRPFVWEDDRRVELLRSLRIGIPIGSLLVWRTTKNRLRCFQAIAGVKIPSPSHGQTVSYLLDGHQRLTTLFAAFAKSGAGGEGDETPPPIFFDLEQDDFVVGNPANQWACLPLHLFLDAVALRQHFRTKEREGQMMAAEVDRLQEIAEGVMYAMQWCRIPIIPLSTDDVELATRTFHRVNSQGVPMTEFHMIAALTWGDDFDLREIFEREWGRVTLPLAWKPASELQTLNVLKGILGMELGRSNGDLLARRIRERPQLAVETVHLLTRAIELASTHLVHTPVAVPYQMQLTLTAIALHDMPSDIEVDTEWLRRWWGLTTAWGSFASAATHRVQAALRHLKSGLAGKHEPWPSLLFSTPNPAPIATLDLRNARARYFADGYASQCDGVNLLNDRGPRAFVTLIAGEGTRMGNRFLWKSEEVESLIQALNWKEEDMLAGHFVDDQALTFWAQGALDEFIRRREVLMNDAERGWFIGLKPMSFITPESQPLF